MNYIAKFNPYSMDDQTILSLATGRKEILENVLSTLRSNLSSDSIPQHLLIRGPRGMGKSFFLKYLQINFKREELFDKSEFILLPEEQSNINTPAELVKLILNIANDEASTGAAPMWSEPDGLWSSELAKLKKYIANKKQIHPDYMMVIVLENLDTFLKNIESDKKKRKTHVSSFRYLLENLECFTLIGAVPHVDSDIDSDYNSRLFHAFKKCTLRPWVEEDYLKYFNRRKIVVEEELDKKYDDQELDLLKAKLKAISLYTGGSPRIAVVLTNLLLEDDVVSTAKTLKGLIDDLTPYYQDLTKSLPKNSRILFDALIRHGENLSQSELAAHVGATQSQISKAFLWLKENGYVYGKKRKGSPAYIYSVKDRIHVLYHMQREIHYNQPISSVWLLCDFLVSFYSPKEIKFQALQHLQFGASQNSNDLAKVYFFSKQLLDKEVLLDLHPAEGWEKVMKEDSRIDEILKSIKSSGLDVKENKILTFNKLLDELFHIFKRISNKNILKSYLIDVLNYVASSHSGKSTIAQELRIRICEKMLELVRVKGVSSLDKQIFILKGLAFFSLERYSESIKFLSKAIDMECLDEDAVYNAKLLKLLGTASVLDNKLEKAIDYYRQSNLRLNESEDVEDIASNHFRIALCLNKINKNEEAIRQFEKASNLFKQIGDNKSLAKSLIEIGDNFTILKKYNDAIRFYIESSVLHKQEGNDYELGIVFQSIGKAFATLGEHSTSIEYLNQSNECFGEIENDTEKALSFLIIAINHAHLGNEREALENFEESFNIMPDDVENELREFIFGLFVVNTADSNLWDIIASKFLQKDISKVAVYKYVGFGIYGFDRSNDQSKCFEIGNRMLNVIPDLFEDDLITNALENLFLGLLKANIKSDLLFDLCDEALRLFPETENQLILKTIKYSVEYIQSDKSETYLEKLNPDKIIAIKEIAKRVELDKSEIKFLT